MNYLRCHAASFILTKLPEKPGRTRAKKKKIPDATYEMLKK